jgi:hypothetical protein
MLAGKYNIVCDQGSTFTRTLEIKTAEGTVFSLVGYTARMEVRRTLDTSTTIVSLTTANGRITINGALGTITLALTAVETAALTQSGVYDLEIVKTATSAVHKVVRGEFKLEKEVSR